MKPDLATVFYFLGRIRALPERAKVKWRTPSRQNGANISLQREAKRLVLAQWLNDAYAQIPSNPS